METAEKKIEAGEPGAALRSLIGQRCGAMPFESKTEYDRYCASNPAVFPGLWQFEMLISELAASDRSFGGYCELCEQPARFGFERDADDFINFREQLACSRCALIARIRAIFLMLRQLLPDPAARIFITEQASTAFAWLRARYPESIGSEYFPDQKRPSLQRALDALLAGPDDGRDDAHNDLRFEDVTQLSFESDSLDAIVSCDVLEHVPDFEQALREFARTLKPSGVLLLTVPFSNASDENLLRARLTGDGSIEHLVEPEYHGDPVNHEGVLAYHSFGWQLLESVRNAGFGQAYWCRTLSPRQLLVGQLWTLVACPEPGACPGSE
ncbi:MAG: class I SAM-dependent methyltransferase [Wenzhouxiangellaceae bacterium]|nr:class I SAM-dependent methyltransferase [Wenzhouxiangellaceae bacterium]